MDKFDIVIVGGGPAGLSAAARAAENIRKDSSAPSYLLLEGFTEPAKTIYDYQKAKPVMDEPGYLDLRSPLDFKAGLREEVLGAWKQGMEGLEVNVRYQSEVNKISGSQGNFVVETTDGYSVGASYIVLSIGLQGNPRKLGVEYDSEPFAQYILVDPDEYRGEKIFVVGAGDAAIENALALSRHNEVVIVNRRKEFSRAKDGNLKLILEAINDPSRSLECAYEANIREVIPNDDKTGISGIVLGTPEGDKSFDADRIIARLGANPPRKLIESFGVAFPNESPTSLPELSEKYESNVPGLYIIGALAGYPLIKQAMNQGYDVVEYISGNDVEPVDYSLLKVQFSQLPYQLGVDDMLDQLRDRIPMFGQINKLALKEVIIEGEVIVALDGVMYDEAVQQLDLMRQDFQRRIEAGEIAKTPNLPIVKKVGSTLYQSGDFSSSLYTIVDGAVKVLYEEGPLNEQTLAIGEFFGENALLSGTSRKETITLDRECILVETPRRIVMKLMNSFDVIKDGIEWIHIARILSFKFSPNVRLRDLYDIVSQLSAVTKEAGEVIYSEGDNEKKMYFIRRGNVALRSQGDSEQKIFYGQLKSGELLGEMALMGDPVRKETAIATLRTELVEIGERAYYQILEMDNSQVAKLKSNVSQRLLSKAELGAQRESGDKVAYLMEQGLGEATNAFFLSEDLCVGCDNCEIACADTHGGISRLKRAEGSSFQKLHIPITCRHCEIPHCMKDCPPNALHKTVSGEVFIDDSCIGCGNCVTNCPYDAIELKTMPEQTASLFQRIFFGVSDKSGDGSGSKQKKAVKCDACKDDPAGPACVRACPTGAAARLDPIEFISHLEQ